ncbi:30S ribosomal protein S9, partial [bacterium]|nr:30S ribosomal protein S9 [bacterium]
MAVKKDNKTYTPAVGKRKGAIARIRILKDKVKSIKITVNDKDYKDYFNYFEWQDEILKPLKLAGIDNVAISIKIQGGGTKGQVDAIKHGIAKALLKDNEEL